MSDKNFDTNKAVQDIFNMISHSRTAEEALEGLTAAAVLMPDARAYIADKLETTMLAELLQRAPEVIKHLKGRADIVAETRKNNPAQLSDMQEELEGFNGMSELIRFVSENKGAAAGPLVKSYIEEAGKLSNEEYALPENLIKALCTAVEKVKVSKTNPFRPNTPAM